MPELSRGAARVPRRSDRNKLLGVALRPPHEWRVGAARRSALGESLYDEPVLKPEVFTIRIYNCRRLARSQPEELPRREAGEDVGLGRGREHLHAKHRAGHGGWSSPARAGDEQARGGADRAPARSFMGSPKARIAEDPGRRHYGASSGPLIVPQAASAFAGDSRWRIVDRDAPEYWAAAESIWIRPAGSPVPVRTGIRPNPRGKAQKILGGS